MKLHFNRYDYGAFLTFIAYAFSSLVIPITLIPLAESLNFPLEDGGKGLGGALQMGRAIPMVAGMIFCGVMAGRFGKAKSLGFSVLVMGIGIMLCAFAPSYSFLMLFIALAGTGEGIIEGIATPFIQDQHPDEPGRYINFSHAFWSVGVVCVTLAAGLALSCGVDWRTVVFCAGALSLPPALLMLAPDKRKILKKENERFDAKTVWCNTREILKKGRFWLFFCAMFLAGGGEYCLTFWVTTYIKLEYAGATMLTGGIGTAVFAGGMIVGRMLSGFCIPQKKLRELILWTAVIAVGTGILLPFVNGLFPLFAVLFILGAATGPFWPSIQSLATTRMKVDNTMLFVLLSCAGVPGCGFFSMLTGMAGDKYGLRGAMYLVPACFLVMGIFLAVETFTKTHHSDEA